ncbi:MAG: ATP-binding protein [Oscillospiraceae bacterium]|nr:ATP-binding protein [Oscillospiraceae bacterium]
MDQFTIQPQLPEQPNASEQYQANSPDGQAVYQVQMQVQVQPTTPIEQQYQKPQLPPVPPPPPCFPRVQESSTSEEVDIFDNSELIFDNSREHMKLLTIVDKIVRRNSGAMDSQTGVLLGGHSKTKSTAYAKVLSIGCVRLIRVYCTVDENGNKSPLKCEVEIIYREPIGRLSLPVDAIRRKDKSFREALAKAGIAFIGDGFKILCEKFSEQISKAEVHIEHTGFYKAADGTWCHVNDRDIALKAVDSQGIPERLGIDFSTVSDKKFIHLTLFLCGVCGRIFTVVRSMNVFPLAKLAVVYPEREAALEDLKLLYYDNDNPPLYPGKLFENQISALRDEVSLISLSKSDYMNRMCLETLEQCGSRLNALPLLISGSEGTFNNRNDVLRLNYDLTGIGSIDGELCWAVKVLLNEPRLSKVLSQKFDYFCSLVKEDTETVSVQHLIALLLSLASSYLPRLGVKGDALLVVLQQYKDYLVNSAYSSHGVIERLKTFLTSFRDIPLIRCDNGMKPDSNAIILKDNMVLFSRSVFDYTAEKCGTTRMALANTLDEIGVLQGNSGQKMRNIRFGDTTERMYVLDCLVLFDVGELRPMCADNHAPKPLYQIPIGTAGNYDIYYDIYPFNGVKNNPFALITGATGTGKSTLCKTLAVNAILLGLSVVIISTDTSAFDLDCNIFEPGEDTEVSVDLFFEELCTGLDEEQTDIVNIARDIMLKQGCDSYTDYDEVLTSFAELVNDEECAESLLTVARKTAYELSGFSWDKAVIDGEISQVIAQMPVDADKILSDFFDYKAAHKDEKRYTLLLLDEVQDFSWDGKSPLVKKILRQGRKFGIVGVFSTQYLNADSGKNIASALKQIGTHFVFRPSDDIAALKQLGYKSSDSNARDVLISLETGEALASGNISTDICPLDYTVKFTVNQDDLNDIL